MAGTGTKRIIELTEASTIQNGDFIAVDSNARGTKKVSTDTLATSAALTAETNARTGADEQMSERMDGIEEQTALIQNPTKTLSGAIAHFTDGADMPMVSCKASIEPKQSGTGTPSPENVRPISGWESVKTSVTGVNVWDEEWKIGAFNTRGEFVTGYNFICSKSPIRVFPNTAYTTNTNILIWEYDADMNIIRDSVQTSSGTIFTTSNNAQYINFRTSQQLTTYNHDISINYPSTDTDYHAYNGTTTTTPLGRTVYGGTLDVVSGVLTVDRAMVDGSNLTFTYAGWTDNPVYYSNYIAGKTCSADKTGVSEVYEILDYHNNEFQYRRFYIRDTTAGGDASVVNSRASGHKFVYYLQNPQTYTLTPTEVKTLLGENNVWADSGDVEITYRRDISIVLENLENALNGSNSLNTMMMSAPTENTAEEPTEDEAEDDMR